MRPTLHPPPVSTTPGERRALLFLGAIAALGAGTKLLRSDESAATPASIEALQRQIAASESVASAPRPRRRRGTRELGPDSALPYDGRIRPLTDAELAGRPAQSPAPAAGSPARSAEVQPPLNINTASAADLQRLPGIGPALAERIIQHRTEHGRIQDLADLDRVRGIGPAMLARLASLVTF